MAGDPKHPTKEYVQELLNKNSINRLDIGGGNNPNAGFINIDILPLEKVDIVWDLETFPWPIPSGSIDLATASHVLEHINPHKGVFIAVMNEIWRVLKPKGQFAFVVPYAESFGMYQDPTHCNFINEATMSYFDPLHPSGYYQFYQPKPWKVINMPFATNGLLECLLEKRAEDKSYKPKKNVQSLTEENLDDRKIQASRTLEQS